MSTTRTGWFEGKAVAYARDDMGMSQSELAEALTEATGESGWNQAKISRIERGTTPMTTPELRAIAKLQGRTWEWYFDGPNYERFIVGGSQRSHHLVGVNGLSLSDNTKTDEEAVGIWLRPRRSMALYGAKDLEPKRVHSHHDSKLFDGEDVVIDLADDESLDRWFDVADERKRIAS